MQSEIPCIVWDLANTTPPGDFMLSHYNRAYTDLHISFLTYGLLGDTLDEGLRNIVHHKSNEGSFNGVHSLYSFGKVLISNFRFIICVSFMSWDASGNTGFLPEHIHHFLY
jgi:hypothetical protein